MALNTYLFFACGEARRIKKYPNISKNILENPNKSKIFQEYQRKDGGLLNRLGFLVLSVLSKNEAFNRVSAMTSREIMDAEELGYKGNTVFKKIAELEKMGYVAAGYKEGKAKSFYITDSGRQALKQA